MSIPCLALLALQIHSTQQQAPPHVPIAQRSVWVVDETGGGDFLAIQPAIDAAADGDLVVVQPGKYGSFTVEGKGVSIVGSGTGGVLPDIGNLFMMKGPSDVLDVPEGSFVALRALAITYVHAQDVAGSLWIEQAFVGQDIISRGNAIDLIDVEACAIVRTNVGYPQEQIGASGRDDGINALRSAVHLFESRSRGFHGGTCFPGGGQGGHGFTAVDSFALLFDSDLLGGEPGMFWTVSLGCYPGWHGLSLFEQTSLVHQLASTFPHGVSGTYSTLLGYPRSLSAPQLIEEGAPFELTITGPPGGEVFTLLSPEPGMHFAPNLYGTVLTGLQPSVMAHGTIPPSGVLVVQVPLPPLSGKNECQPWVVQSLQIDGGSSYLSSGSIAHVVKTGVL